MLETEPAGSYVKADILEMWRKMLPLTVSQFRRYWLVAEARMSDCRKMINTDQASFQRWEISKVMTVEGMRNK